MNTKWIIWIFLITMTLLTILKGHQLKSLHHYYRYEGSPKLSHFEKKKIKLTKKDVQILALWESILTGRSAPVSRIIKEKYKLLGLNHIFTPSGFHLSALLSPIFLLIRNRRIQLTIIVIMGSLLSFFPGFGALKRMTLIKGNQKIFGMREGFIIALIIDILFGTFQTNPLSFTYSFLFLGIIYSGVKNLGLIIWFFFAQLMLAYFESAHVSILLLIFSPLINLGFTILMPLLLLLSYPLSDWQLNAGIFMLQHLHDFVFICAEISAKFPLIEVTVIILFLNFLFLVKNFRLFIVVFAINSGSLNMDNSRIPSPGKYEFIPKEKILTKQKKDHISIVYKNGFCNAKLIRGYWWEKCSPFKRSTEGKRKRKRKNYL